MTRRRALITGATGGLGSALMQTLLQANYEVHGPSRLEMDVRDSAAMRSYFECQGAFDFVVHCAGSLSDALSLKLPEADWNQTLNEHLRAAWDLARSAYLARSRDNAEGLKDLHMVFIGSHSAHHGKTGQIHYASAKAGLEGLARSLAKEWGDQGVRVNVVLPGFLQTQMTASLDPHHKDRILSEHALKRFNTAEDAARMICMLDSMSAVSGQTFSLDSRVQAWV